MMLISLSKATTNQLLLIISKDKDCPLDLLYEVMRESQIRWGKDMLIDLIRLYGQNKEVWEIAEYLGIDEKTIREKIQVYQLAKGRVKREQSKCY